MKRILLLLAFISSIGAVSAQGLGAAAPAAVTGRITGSIVDSVTRTPIDYATIAVGRAGTTRSTNGALTDEKGSFKVENIAAGSYRITIAFLGYQTKIIDSATTTAAKPDLNLGRILLLPNAKALGEVVVTGTTPIVENKIDKLVYNAEQDVAIAGGNATDVLRKVPLLSVDFEGNVSLRGSQNVRVLINGKPSGSMANNMADALKAIPADQIKNVEVITSPSAKYDAEGTSGIINIITKKNNLAGVSGSVNAGVGTRQNSGNVNLNAKTGRLAVTANGGGFYSWPQTSTISFNRSTNNGSQVLKQTGKSESDRLAANGSIGVDYDFNAFNSIGTNLRLNGFNTQVDGSNINENSFGGVPVLFTRLSDNSMEMNGIDWSSDFLHKFKKKDQQISLAYQLSHSVQQSNYLTDFSNTGIDEYGDNDADNTENTIQLDYTHPFKKVTLETGVKGILRDIISDNRTRNFNSNTSIFTPISARTYIYDYNQDVYSAYATFAFTIAKKYGIRAGARYEATEIEGDARNFGTGVSPFSSSYYNLVPSFVVSRTFKNYSTIKLSYNQRLQRPSLFYLNPFLNSADIFNQSQGNPSLKPELSHNIEFNYSMFVKKTVVNASVFYRRTNDIIESFILPISVSDPSTGNTVSGSRTTYRNVGNNNSVGFNFFGQINPVKPLTFRGNFNVFTYDINTNSSVIVSNANLGVQMLYNGFLMATYLFPKGLTFETFLITNSPRRTAQGQNPSFNMWNLGLKKEILAKKGSIGLTVIDPFNENKNFRQNITGSDFTQTSNFSLPFRSFGMSFSYRFGKMTMQAPRKKRGVTNDDLKQNEQNTGNQ
ncbi:TonB-dependent receptor domain-containing protein [Daejeonella sp.]|uniref:TonB-dependent receptor domain-containing protein n=1 Tax=Daejeonella sp. TaxID=2805397 RepID=UPI0039834BE6